MAQSEWLAQVAAVSRALQPAEWPAVEQLVPRSAAAARVARALDLPQPEAAVNRVLRVQRPVRRRLLEVVVPAA